MLRNIRFACIVLCALLLAYKLDTVPAAAAKAISVLDLLELEVGYDTLADQFYRRTTPAMLAGGARTGIVAYLVGKHVADPDVPLIPAAKNDALPAIERTVAATLLRYGDRVDAREVVYAALDGEAAAVGDTYTTFFTPQQFRDFNHYLDAPRFGGVGAVISSDPATKRPQVDEIVPQSPAQRAGLAAGDAIAAIDGRPTAGVDLDTISKLLRGRPGTVVRLDIVRDGKTLAVPVTRAFIDPPTVYAKLLPNAVAYIKLTVFGGTTADELRRALARLNAQGATSYVLDLRDNGGGYRDTAIKVASAFVPAGPILTVEEQHGHRTVFGADGTSVPRKPLAVLVNGSTASASEIVAGAIQDDGLGTIVGDRTYGKGLVQAVFPLPDGSALKVTTGRYFTAHGRDVNTVGITPDLSVAEPDGSVPGDPEHDSQLAKALEVLGRYPLPPAK